MANLKKTVKKTTGVKKAAKKGSSAKPRQPVSHKKTVPKNQRKRVFIPLIVGVILLCLGIYWYNYRAAHPYYIYCHEHGGSEWCGFGEELFIMFLVWSFILYNLTAVLVWIYKFVRFKEEEKRTAPGVEMFGWAIVWTPVVTIALLLLAFLVTRII